MWILRLIWSCDCLLQGYIIVTAVGHTNQCVVLMGRRTLVPVLLGVWGRKTIKREPVVQ